jgi:hypothetical protein
MKKDLKLTVDMLRAVYNMLCTVPPFDKWNLPDGDDIVFVVGRDRNLRGWCIHREGKWKIGISNTVVARLNLLICTMMHEMIHVHEDNVEISRRDVQHSQAFLKWAEHVCQIHNLDPHIF